jgi:hypothetical protein
MLVNNQRYFVQARLKLTILDTAGLKGFLHLANPQNSYWGCWSCRFHAVPGEQTNYPYFGGHRCYLSLGHYLRSLGKTEQCCPKGYYLTDDNIISNDFRAKKGSSRAPFVKVDKVNCRNNGRIIPKSLISCSPTVNLIQLKQFLSNSTPYVTHHPNVDLTDLAESIHYHTCDYRDQKQISLLLNHEFCELIQLHPAYYKEPFFMMALKYFDIRKDVPYGQFHAFKNVALNLLECMKGERAKKTPQMMEYSDYTRTHLPHFEKETFDSTPPPPPWLYSQDEQHRIDSYINCIVIPRGLSNEFAFSSIFQQTGFLRCADLIKFLKIVLNLIPFISSKGAYDIFYQMISADCCDLMAPFFSEEDLIQLQDRLIETVALHEGLFPITESKFTFHQLIHLVDNIRNWGPLTNSSEAAGERAIASIKRTCPTAGGEALFSFHFLFAA